MDRAHSTQAETGAGPARPDFPAQARAAFGPAADPQVRMALLGLRLDRLEHLEAAARERAQAAVAELLARQEGAERWWLRRAGDTWWALVPGPDVKESLALARALVDAGRALVLEEDGRRRRLSLSVGLAHSCHRSKPTLGTCVAVVEEGLRVAAAGGGRRAVHSEVYGAFTSEEPASAPEVAPAPPPGPAREVELPRAAPERPSAAGPVLSVRPAGASAPSPDDEPQHPDWSGWLHGVGAAPAAAPAAPPAPGGDSELLHRRLTKITVELEKAEAEIARLRAALARDEAGLASIYREVQGLSEDAPEAGLKRELMERLFQANVALREMTARLPRQGASA